MMEGAEYENQEKNDSVHETVAISRAFLLNKYSTHFTV